MVIGRKKGEVLHISKYATQSLLYECFAEGLLSRMGRNTQSYLALDHRILLIMIVNIKRELHDRDKSQSWIKKIIIIATYFSMLCMLAFPGNEEFMLDFGVLLRYINYGKELSVFYLHMFYFARKIQGRNGN